METLYLIVGTPERIRKSKGDSQWVIACRLASTKLNENPRCSMAKFWLVESPTTTVVANQDHQFLAQLISEKPDTHVNLSVSWSQGITKSFRIPVRYEDKLGTPSIVLLKDDGTAELISDGTKLPLKKGEERRRPSSTPELVVCLALLKASVRGLKLVEWSQITELDFGNNGFRSTKTVLKHAQPFIDNGLILTQGRRRVEYRASDELKTFLASLPPDILPKSLHR
jgi:hypothetical protein